MFISKVYDTFLNVKNNKFIQYFPRILFCFVMLFQLFLGRSLLGSNDLLSMMYGQFERHAGLVIIAFCLIFKKFTKKELYVYMGALFLLYIIAFYHHAPYNSVLMLSLVLLLKDEKREWIGKTLFNIYLLVFFGVITLYLFGFVTSHMSITLSNGLVRNSLGFIHPNTTGVMFLVIFICYLLQGKKNWLLIGLFLGGYLALNQFIGSTTPLLIMFLITGLVFLKETSEQFNINFGKIKKSMYVMIWSSPLFLLILSYFLAVVYHPQSLLLERLNLLLTHRIKLSQVFIREYQVNLFGNFLFSPGSYENGWRFLDNGYLWLLLAHGVVYTVALLIYFIWVSRKMHLAGFKYVPIIFLGIAVYSFSEHGIITYWINVLLLFGGTFLKETVTSNS